MNKIVITTSSFGKYDKRPLELLQESRFDVTLNPYKRKLEKNEIVELCNGATGIIAGTESLDAGVIEKLINLKVISRCGSGLDNVDLAAGERRGIKVFNTPDGPVLAVSELTVGLILDLLRRITRMHADLMNNKWQKRMGNLLYKKKVGIIGFGKIGKKVANLLKAFDCELAFTDPYVEDKTGNFKCLALDKLLSWADIISLHASGVSMILGKRELQLMKKGAWLVNLSRGGVVDEDALYKLLKDKYLTGAAIDTFGREPYTGPLQGLNNAILTPHIGSYAKEARVKMETQAVKNLLSGLQSGINL